jgi:hypothetical protein
MSVLSMSAQYYRASHRTAQQADRRWQEAHLKSWAWQVIGQENKFFSPVIEPGLRRV